MTVRLGNTLGGPRPDRQPVNLLARRYVDGEIHRYREDDMADPRNEHVVPMCEEREPEPKQHLREQVSHDYPGGGPWCHGCAAFPGVVMREPR